MLKFFVITFIIFRNSFLILLFLLAIYKFLNYKYPNFKINIIEEVTLLIKFILYCIATYKTHLEKMTMLYYPKELQFLKTNILTKLN
jgi:hypothetical protein